jgi:hypothetical protein
VLFEPLPIDRVLRALGNLWRTLRDLAFDLDILFVLPFALARYIDGRGSS